MQGYRIRLFQRDIALNRAVPAFAVIALAGGLFPTLHRRPATHVPTAAVRKPTPAPAPAPAPPGTLLLSGTTAVPVIVYSKVSLEKHEESEATPAELREQMQKLSESGAHPVSVQALIDHLSTGKPLPEHPIVLTFDDAASLNEALPVLRQYSYPAAFFVRPASIESGNAHITWEQLKAAEATGLVTVESDSVTLSKEPDALPYASLARAVAQSKLDLEKHIGHTIQFLAYPPGACDARVAKAAMAARYTAAFTMEDGWAASPAQSYFLPRVGPGRLTQAISVWQGNASIEPPLPRMVECQNTPLERGTFEAGKCQIRWVAGGLMGSKLLSARETVGNMAWSANVQAALNGTFYTYGRYEGSLFPLIGPALSREGDLYQPSLPSHDDAIEGRPLVLLGGDKCLLLPYAAHLGHSREVLSSLLPEVQDAFVAGAWIVHNGHALAHAEMLRWGVANMEDLRHRAFAGIDGRHRYFLGAVQTGVSTTILGSALEKMGVEEAWLMDSGYSTALVWQNHVIASGHSLPERPSRPAPHALLLYGSPASDAQAAPPDSPLAGGPGAITVEEAIADDEGGSAHRARHHRRHGAS